MLCLIIDEQDEFERQITELKENATLKDAELCRLHNELAEMKKTAQVVAVSKTNGLAMFILFLVFEFSLPFPAQGKRHFSPNQ